MEMGFHQSFKIGDKVKIKPHAIQGIVLNDFEVTDLIDVPEMYQVENEYHKIIVGNGNLTLIEDEPFSVHGSQAHVSQLITDRINSIQKFCENMKAIHIEFEHNTELPQTQEVK